MLFRHVPDVFFVPGESIQYHHCLKYLWLVSLVGFEIQIDSMQIKNINIAILAMADAPEQSLNLTSEVDHTVCPENTNYFAKSSPSNLRHVFKSIQNFY